MARFFFDLKEIGQSITAPLVVVMPVYNEEANISKVISDWCDCLKQLQVDFQIVAIDDGSKDETAAILLQLESEHADLLCVVSKPNNGHGITCRTGYEIAVHSNAEWILQIDSDGQCAPQHFADFWNNREQFDCIFGVRTSRDDGLPRRLTSKICRLGSSVVCGEDLKDPNVPYRLIRRKPLQEALQHIPSSFNIHNVALTYVLKKTPGLRWQYVDIHFPNRQGGTNNINTLQVMIWGIEMLLELTRIRARLRRALSRR
jgi:glycosyltransferase involved in cell wall biosynthesis